METCLDALTEEQIWLRHGDSGNAIGNIVLHLCGNLRQWIGFGVSGLADVRDRDAEFAARGGVPVVELKQRLAETIGLAAGIIEKLPLERLTELVTIQGYRLTVFEAVYHVVEHFAEHYGQIVFATKLLTGEDLKFYGHLRGPRPHAEKTP